jgi:hypothetical protein
MTYVFLDWPAAWDGGDGVPECELTDSYLKTCIERWKVMRWVMINVRKHIGEQAFSDAQDRYRCSRSVIVVAAWHAMIASDIGLLAACKKFGEIVESKPILMNRTNACFEDCIIIENLLNEWVRVLTRRRRDRF